MASFKIRPVCEQACLSLTSLAECRLAGTWLGPRFLAPCGGRSCGWKGHARPSQALPSSDDNDRAVQDVQEPALPAGPGGVHAMSSWPWLRPLLTQRHPAHPGCLGKGCCHFCRGGGERRALGTPGLARAGAELAAGLRVGRRHQARSFWRTPHLVSCCASAGRQQSSRESGHFVRWTVALLRRLISFHRQLDAAAGRCRVKYRPAVCGQFPSRKPAPSADTPPARQCPEAAGPGVVHAARGGCCALGGSSPGPPRVLHEEAVPHTQRGGPRGLLLGTKHFRKEVVGEVGHSLGCPRVGL